MPNVNIDYSNTIFYKIYCMNQEITDKYIGHTTDFVKRKYSHKQSCNNHNNNCKLYNIIRENGGWNNWKMEIIAFHDCENHYEARKREQQYFEEYNATLNSIEPLPKHKVITTNNQSKSNHGGQKCKKCKCTQCTPSAEEIKQFAEDVKRFKQAMHKSDQAMHKSDQAMHESEQAMHESKQAMHEIRECTHSAEEIKQFKQELHESRELRKMVKDLLNSKGRT